MQHLSSALSYSGFYVGCVIVVTKKRRSDGDDIGDMNPHVQVNSECEDDVHVSSHKKSAGLQILFASFVFFWFDVFQTHRSVVRIGRVMRGASSVSLSTKASTARRQRLFCSAM